jgi:hypothetical protein
MCRFGHAEHVDFTWAADDLTVTARKKSFLRFLRATSLDLWGITTLLFWIVAFFSSLALHLNYRQTDPLDLSMPVAIGSLAIVFGVCAAAIFKKALWQSFILFAATIAVGVFICVYAGYWLDMEQPQWVSMDYGEAKPRDSAEYIVTYSRLVAFGVGSLLGLFLTRYVLVRSFPTAIVFSNLLASFASLLNRYRKRVMIAFVVIMLPATVLRNVFDPQMQSASFLTSATLIIGLGFCWFVGFYGLVQIASTPGWARTKRVATILSFLIGGCYLSGIYWNTYTETLGLRFAMGIAPFLFVLTVVTCMATRQTPSSEATRKWSISVWSLLITVPVFSVFGWSIYAYDLRVIATACLEKDDFFSNSKWLELAKQSRDFQRATDGSARMIESYSSTLLHVKIRDQRDADCLEKLFQYQPTISAWFVIDNLQPFVDTKPLRNHRGHLTLVGGQCTASQMADIAFKVPVLGVPVLGVQATRLPNQVDGRIQSVPLNLPKLQTYGSRVIPGLADFLDAYVPAGLNDVMVNTPATAKDWAAIVRHNQQCKFLVYAIHEESSELGLQTLESSKDQSLAGISFCNYADVAPGRLLRLMLESDIQPIYLPLEEERAFWDLAFLRPDGSLNDWFESPLGALVDHAKECHWSFGHNDQGEITRIWLPDLDLLRNNTSSLKATETLRLDSDGICGVHVFLETDVSVLAKFVNLKRLYLSRDHVVSDLGFLRSMPKLQHLQMQSQDRKVMATTGLEVCKNLESIRIFGKPDPQTVTDLAALKKLKSLEIIDDEAEFQNQAGVETLRRQLPNVEIRIIVKDDYEPDLSDNLKEHLKRVRKGARERLVKLVDEMENEGE